MAEVNPTPRHHAPQGQSRLIRVFPRRTSQTPDDPLAYVGPPDLFAEADAVHVSVAFTWDVPRAERLARQWEQVAPVEVGGPAYGKRGEEFVPGKYLRDGCIITSRGCPRKCWFCRVPKVEGAIRELAIADGWCIQDDNLLACSEGHIRAVFAMLARQKRRAEFRGGLEALLLEDWHVDLFAGLSPRPSLYFAYDPGDDYGTILDAGRKLLAAGFTQASHRLRCYVLIGWPKDTMADAEKRLVDVLRAGFTPMAMLWKRPKDGATSPEWRAFQRRWARPAIIHAGKERGWHG